jgi:hypothetical protein
MLSRHYIYIVPPSKPVTHFSTYQFYKTRHLRYIGTMNVDTGRCLGAYATSTRTKEKRIDPLWHILLHEKTPVKSVKLTGSGRRYIVALVEHLSGEIRWRYTGPRFTPPAELLAWAESTEHALSWIKSPRALRAPSFWPDAVDHAFGQFMPDPWELANAIPVNLRGQPETWYGHDVCALVSYACGLSVFEISKITRVNQRAVIAHMCAGAKKLNDIPQFRLWCMNLDWSNLAGIALQGEPMHKRREFFEELEKTPLGLSKRDVDKAMESVVFKFGTDSNMTPKREEHRPIHKHVMVTEPR